MSVCPSVRPSVTRWHWVKTTQARITKSSPTESPRTPVFGIKNSSRNSKGFTPSKGVKWELGRENSQFSANNSPYLRNSARQDQSYYKWLIATRIRPFDWCQNQRPWMTWTADTHSVAEKMCLSEPITKKLNEDRPILPKSVCHWL